MPVEAATTYAAYAKGAIRLSVRLRLDGIADFVRAWDRVLPGKFSSGFYDSERERGRAQSSPFPFASYVSGIDLRIVALDFLNQPFEHAQIGVRVRLRSDRPLGSMRMGKCVEVIVHVRMVFRESLFPEPVQPVALEDRKSVV